MQRLEIIGSGRRRRFSKEMKLPIVAESYSEPGLCATTARRLGISRSQLYQWRRLARAWQLDAASPVGVFVPALLAPEVEPAAGIVDHDVDVEARLRVLRGLEALR